MRAGIGSGDVRAVLGLGDTLSQSQRNKKRMFPHSIAPRRYIHFVLHENTIHLEGRNLPHVRARLFLSGRYC